MKCPENANLLGCIANQPLPRILGLNKQVQKRFGIYRNILFVIVKYSINLLTIVELHNYGRELLSYANCNFVKLLENK